MPFNKLRTMDLDTYIGEVKWKNAINRITAVANPYQIERVPAGVEFNFQLVYNIENIAEVAVDIKILANGLKLFPLIKKKIFAVEKKLREGVSQ